MTIARKYQSRFAAHDAAGRMVALVADGIEWPEDGVLGALDDGQLLELETQYVAEFEALAADPEADMTAMETLLTRVQALRDEAAARLSAAPPAAVEPPANDPPAPAPGDGPAPSPEELAAARDARIAEMRASLSPPAPGETIEPGPTFTREDLMAAVSAGAEVAGRAAASAVQTALAAQPTPAVVSAEPARLSAAPRRLRAADLAGRRPDSLAPVVDGTPHASFNARLLATTDSGGIPQGTQITNRDQLRQIMESRARELGTARGVDDEKVVLAAAVIDPPEQRDLRGMSSDWAAARNKIREVCGAEAMGYDWATGEAALIASGGLAAPVEPYYQQLVLAQDARPVLDAHSSFVADRGGIRLVPPPSIGTLAAATAPGTFTDGVTATSTALASATANFTGNDLGSPVYDNVGGTIIPPGTVIATVTDSGHVVLSAATLSTGIGVTFRIGRRNPNLLGNAVGIVTAAQDAAGPPNTVKFTYDIPDGTQVEFDVYSVYTSLQGANLTSRTFPEQIDAYLRVASALAARVAEQQFLDTMTLYSTKLTANKTFGAARQLLAQLEHVGALYRNVERMDPNAVLRCGVPAWSINLCRADYLSTFMGSRDAAAWGLSDDEIIGFFEQAHLAPYFYQDGPSDISQLFSTAALAAATNTGTNTATPTPVPDWPGSGATTSFRTHVVSFIEAEGTFLALTTGELNIGLVRDSTLNSQNRFRNFVEEWETPAFVGTRCFRTDHTVAADGTYGTAAAITLGVGSGI